MQNTSKLPTKMFGVEFTLTIGCQHHCKYCPQDKLLASYDASPGSAVRRLSFEHFKIALRKVRQGTDITIGGMSEPFQNKDCAKMLCHAVSQGYKVTLLSTLQGMTEADFQAICRLPLETFVVHLPDAEGNAAFDLSDTYLALLRRVIDQMHVDYFSCQGTVHDKVKPMLKKQATVASSLLNRAGNLEFEELKTVHNEGKLACFCGTEMGTVGWTPVMLPDGSLVHCSMDYGMRHVLGNLITQEWTDIIQSPAFLRCEQGADDASIDLLCRRCCCAHQRTDRAARYHHLAGAQAVKIGRLFEAMRTGSPPPFPAAASVFQKLLRAKNICVWGLGSLFQNYYFPRSWDVVIGANLLCDSDPAKWGTSLGNIPCVAPQDLANYEALLVVTFVRDDSAIRQRLQALGIAHYMNIFELYNIFD